MSWRKNVRRAIFLRPTDASRWKPTVSDKALFGTPKLH
jgi:hypothetical protein